MRILSLCLSYTLGGLELYTCQSMQWFWERGHLGLAIVRPSTPLDEKVRSLGLPYRNLECRGRSLLRAAWTLSRIIDDEMIDAVHINWGGDLKLAVLAKRLSRKKPALVYSRHMRIPDSKRDPYHRWIYQQVNRLIVTTTEMYAQATTHLPIDTARVHHLYLGVVPPQSIDPDECKKFLLEGGLTSERFRIGLFGRIEHAKGQHVLVDSVRQLLDSGCDVQAAIVGKEMHPAYHNDLKNQIAGHGLRDRIQLLGFVADASRFMPCFDVIVLTSYCEHFGLVLAEAMHAGVAVIGTNAGGVPEIIDDGVTGLLCEPGSAVDLTAKIEQLYRHEQMRKTLALRGQSRARKMFSATQHFETLYRHFEQAA